ncbi:phage tail tape measure protein [Microbacterium sp. M]|uniref:phage tail tape measure protein n=1 Tax=Microbacterium sp. M TaxID=3377125 RepID=UPI00386C3CFB
MADNLDAKAVISAQIDGIKQVLDALSKLESGIGDVASISGDLNKINKSLKGVQDGFVETGNAAKASSKNVKYSAQGFEEYVKALGKANKAQRQFAQEKVVKGFSPSGIPATDAGSMSRQERDNALQVHEAATTGIIQGIRKRNAEEDKASRERQRLIERENGLYNDYLENQFKADRKAADNKVREAKRAIDEVRRLNEKEVDGLISSGMSTATRGINAGSSHLAGRPKAPRASSAGMGDWDNQFNTAVADADAKVRALAASQQELADLASPRMRYALYDVATTTGIFTAGITAAGVAVTGLASSFESSFTNVERTLSDDMGGAAVKELRGELVGLTREMPLAFSQITEIATLGNQLGIAGADVGKFSETVAQFSTVTGLSVDATATAFGSLSELLRNEDGSKLAVAQYQNLGSAIAYVGRTSVATEAEIIAMSTRLAASASNAGFSAQQVIALSGAFASLRIAPERAQGVMEVYFNRLNTAISQGGPKLEAFARYAGLATSEVEGLVRSDPVEYFRRLATGLGSMDQIAQTGALEQLGLQGIRAGEVFGRVAANVDVFNQAMANSSTSWSQGTELGDQYSLVLDDMATKWQIFLNALSEAGAVIGGILSPALLGALEMLTGMVQGFTDFASTDIGGFLLRTAGLIAGVTAALGGLITVAALGAGAMYAMRLAAVEFGLVSATNTTRIGMFTKSLLGMNSVMGAAGVGSATVARGFMAIGSTAGFAARAANMLTVALKTVAKATVVFGLLQFGMDLLFGGTEKMTGGLMAGMNAANQLGSIDLGKLGDSAEEVAGDIGDVGGAADGAAAKVRTLVDYANDLASVMSRATDIRFASGSAFDTITSGWYKIAEAANEAREAAAEHRRELASMGADRAVKQYWLSVAENYGDELRAAKLRAELAELDGEMAAEKKDLAKAQDEASMSLTGNSQAAIANRASILGLVGNYQDYLKALAASGMSQADLERESVRLRSEFVAQATALGYNRGEVDRYAASFDDMAKIINAVPWGVTVAFNADPALLALNEFIAQAEAAASAGGTGAGNAFGSGFDLGLEEELAKKRPSKHVGRAMPVEEASMQGGLYAGGLMNGLEATLRPGMDGIRTIGENWVTEERARALGIGGLVGGALAGGLKTTTDTDLSAYKPLDGWAAAQMGSAWNAGSSVGRTVSGGLMAGMTAALKNVNIGSNGTGGIRVENGYASGGYTGNLATNQVAGVVHGQEYVMSAQAVRNAGGPGAMDAMHQLFKAGKGFSPVGLAAPVASGPGVVDISASSARLIADILAANLKVILPGAQLAGSVGRHNVNSASRGGS